MWQSRPKGERPGRIEITGPEHPPAGPRVAVDEDGLITVASMDGVALAFVAITNIRERQAELMREKLMAVAERARGRIAVSLSEASVMTSAGEIPATDKRCRRRVTSACSTSPCTSS